MIGENSYIGNSFIEYIEQLEGNQWLIDKISIKQNQWEQHDFIGYDVVLHLAAIVHQKETKKNKQDYYRINRDLAIHVAEKARKSRVGQFIFMSTAAVYGSHVNVITKDTLPMPDTRYGKSKLEAEEEIIRFNSDTYKVAIVRPPMVYGAGCKGNFERLVKLARITPIFPDIQNKRSMIYIDNLCEFLKKLIEQETWGYFHPQNEEYICTSEMVREIGEGLGRKIYFTKIFNWGIRLLMKRVGILNKLFGDCYYKLNKTEAKTEQLCYEVMSFRESIEKSTSSGKNDDYKVM